jgi:hypothetical protein
MKSPSAHILVTCTKRKRWDSPARLRLGTVGKGSPDDVARRWVQRLEETAAVKVRAASLYAGDHWQIAAGLPATAAACGVKAQLWVLSAGYGLIAGSAQVAPYSATFSVGHPDEVLNRFNKRDVCAVRDWWASLSQWSGPHANDPRTITDLVLRNPHIPIVVIASPKYLAAIQDDLLKARTVLADPATLIVVSAGARGRGPLAESMIDCSARLQAALGGALMSLNARVARSIIEKEPTYPWTVSGFQRLLERIPMDASEGRVPSRKAVTDDEVRIFVRNALRANPMARHTSLLRAYREAGYACEQKRFGRLFKEMEQSHAGAN